jgi:hypothetical protein
MKTYNYDLEIQASSEQEAEIKMKSISVLLKKLNYNEIMKLAHIVQNDPIKTALAKKALGV